MTPYPNLGSILNDLPYHYFYPQADQFLELNLPFKNFQSLPLPPGVPKNSANILSLFKPTVPSPLIIPFKPSAKIELICKQNKWKLAASDARLNRLLEDKHRFTNLAKKHLIPSIPSLIGPLNPEFLNQASADFGPELVIQTHFGWAGQCTFLFNNSQNSLPVALNTPVKIMPLLAGTTYTNNCCLTRWGSIIGPPGLQINGLPKLSPNPFATTGRQWPSNLPTSQVTKLLPIAQKVAHLLHSLNFRGFYGVDYLVTPKTIYVLEINPRLTASTNFYTQLEINAAITPTLYWHLAEFLDINLPEHTYNFKPYYSNQLVGTEITPKSNTGHTINKIWLSKPLALRFPPVYDLTKLHGF